jgi:hypothetical protein
MTKQVEEMQKVISELKNKTIEDSKKIEETKESLAKDLGEFDKRYKNDVFGKIALIEQERTFIADADIYKKNSNRWFWGIIISAIFFLGVLWLVFRHFCFELACFDKNCTFNYDTICKEGNRTVFYLEIFKAVAYRLFLISFFTYVINICLKNYNANMHNYTINMHKANSLAAALILLSKAKTDEGNDQIMTQAANAIFTHQPTGFNNKTPENMSSSIIEKVVDKVKG